MHLPPHSKRLTGPSEHLRVRCRTGQRAAATALLGHRHPLTIVLGRLETITTLLLVVAGVHALGLLLWGWGDSRGAALAIGALALEAVLGCRLVLMLETRRALCLELVAEGHERLPLAVGRERLSDQRHQARLAQSVARLAHPDPLDGPPFTARPPIDRRIVSDIAGQLDEIVDRLRTQQVAPPAVALVEQLISSPTSPLYGSDAERLRRELGRVRYLG